MKVKAVLKQHPVDHGGFHTEQFFLHGDPVPSVTVLYDCGATAKGRIESQVRAFLKSLDVGVTKIDAIYLSHYDYDHVSGLALLGEQLKKRGVSVTHVIAPYLSFEQKIAVVAREASDSAALLQLVVDPETWLTENLGVQYVHLALPSVGAERAELSAGEGPGDRGERGNSPPIDRVDIERIRRREDYLRLSNGEHELMFRMTTRTGSVSANELVSHVEMVSDAATGRYKVGHAVWRMAPWSLEELAPLSWEFRMILAVLADPATAEYAPFDSGIWYDGSGDGFVYSLSRNGRDAEDQVNLLKFLAANRAVLRGISMLLAGPDGSNRSSIVLDSAPVGDSRTVVYRQFGSCDREMLSDAGGGWLLTGDAGLSNESTVEEMSNHLWGAEMNRVSVLSAPHHGSQYNSSRKLFEIVGANNLVLEVPPSSSKHPHKDFLALVPADQARYDINSGNAFTLETEIG